MRLWMSAAKKLYEYDDLLISDKIITNLMTEFSISEKQAEAAVMQHAKETIAGKTKISKLIEVMDNLLAKRNEKSN